MIRALMNDTINSPAPVTPPLLFQRLRGRLLTNSGRVLLRASGLRVFTILVFSVLVWGCVFAASWSGLQFMRVRGMPAALLEDIIGTLLDLFFLSLTLMLVFSGGIILY